MAFTTLVDLVTTAAALPVTGVTKQVAYRPRQINAADLPLMFTRLPNSERSIATFPYGQGLRAATLQLVIFVQFLRLNEQPANDALTVELLDNVAASLEANAEPLGMDRYTLTTEEDTLGENTAVQAIIATMEVSG